MAVQTVPYALQNASHSAALFRQSASAAFVTGGALSSIELAVTQQGSPNMSVILGAGRAKVVGTSVSPPAGQSFTTQAMYDTLNDAPLTLTIAASNPTNPRIDLVYIQVQDSFYSGASNQAIAGVVTGTPAASPSVPATPANAVAIATVAVGAGVTTIVNANISRVIARASLLGSGFVADLDALAAVTGMSTGDIREVAELAALFTYSGSAWIQVTDASFSSAAARDTAYNKASGAYKVAGRARVYRSDTGYTQAWNGTAWRYLNAAQIPVIATSVVNGTLGAAGSISFSAVTSVSVNGCFTTEYDNYVVIFEQLSSTTNGPISVQLRAGGVNATAANYHYETLAGASTSASASASGLVTSWFAVDRGSVLDALVTMNVCAPALARNTSMTFGAGMRTSASAGADVHISAWHMVASAYDGITFAAVTGTMTGTIRIYGWNNN